jgi:hypothetical protein
MAKIRPQWDYARLELLPNVPIIDGKATFVFRATANLQSVSFAMGKTDEPAARTYDLIYLIREGRESLPRVTVSMGDWTFDIDALGAYGKIAQHCMSSEHFGRSV